MLVEKLDTTFVMKLATKSIKNGMWAVCCNRQSHFHLIHKIKLCLEQTQFNFDSNKWLEDKNSQDFFMMEVKLGQVSLSLIQGLLNLEVLQPKFLIFNLPTISHVWTFFHPQTSFFQSLISFSQVFAPKELFQFHFTKQMPLCTNPFWINKAQSSQAIKQEFLNYHSLGIKEKPLLSLQLQDLQIKHCFRQIQSHREEHQLLKALQYRPR